MISKLTGEITPDRWTGKASKDYPVGQDPWSDIFTTERTIEIAQTIGLRSPAEILALRLQLAATAEYLLSVFDFVGGGATPAQKHAWAEKIDTLSRRLSSELSASNDLVSSVVIRSGTTTRFVPASEMRRRVKETKAAIAALSELVQAVSNVPKEDFEETGHAETMQAVVNGMTEVFIDFKGIENVKRSASSGHIDGVFPEFIRAAARPFLIASYARFARDPKRLEKLNRQIQKAVADYRPHD